MQHTCADCDHQFFTPGQSDGPSVQPAAQCPNCQSYRTQPGGIPDEQNDMNHGIGAMPTSTQDDMSGNPLKEGILADGGWQNRDKRDEAFASVRRSDYSLFESPEFETTQLIAPPDLYHDGVKAESANRYAVQIPKGITDNLHAALGNLQAWVENPYEDGQLRPYNQYWKALRPSFMKPGSLQIGVADPPMAEIINHVAHTDDLTPLYQYRGKTSSTHTAGPLLEMIPWAMGSGLMAGGADAGAAAGLAAGGDAAASAGAAEGASSASGVGGVMNKVMQGMPTGAGMQVGKGLMGTADDMLGFGSGQGGGGGSVPPSAHDMSYYASDEDDAHPEAHDEIPKNDDGDAHEQDDGNNHEWQRDVSVNGGGGTDHSPSFQSGGPAMQRFMMLAPLLIQMIEGGQSGADDPLVQGLHHSLDAELPGYLDHADDHAAEQLILMLKPKQESPSAATPEKNEPDHTDENSGGAHESRVASLHGHGEVAEFLPDLEISYPALNGFRRTADMMPPMGGPPMGGPPGGAPMGPPPPSPMSAPPAMPAGPAPSDQGSQGPTTDEQQAWFARWLEARGRGDEVPDMLANPVLYAKEFAIARKLQVPPQAPEDDAGMSANPPMPAQENAPPGDTMPVPGMEQQMTSAVRRYAADSVASKCPNCGSHTTEVIDEEGTSSCHGCHKIFKTKGKHPKTIDKDASTWNVDEDLRKEADSGELPSAADDPAPVQGVPVADQQHQHDVRQEQDSGHTWTDEGGNPLHVGSEYEMYTQKYDIPDLVRIEAIKPTALNYTIVGEFGLEQANELTKQEANIDGTSFKSVNHEGELGQGDLSLEENNDDNTGYHGEPERTDMSAPSGLVSASVVASGVDRENPQLGWLKPAGGFHTAGANYTPMEQRALIDEQGAARNADMLDLSGTHYITDADEDQFLFGL